MSDALAVFLINLDASTARRATAERWLDEVGLRATRIAARDGAAPADRRHYGGLRARLRFGRSLAAAELGCFLSHRDAARRFLDSGARLGLVLEDDARPLPGAAALLAGLTGHLPAAGWDAANLGAAATQFRHAAPGTEGRALPLPAHLFPLTTHAILWSREGAARFLARTARIDMALDHWLRHEMTRSGRGLGLAEPLFGTDGAASDIGADGRRDCLTAGQVYRCRRALRRWRNKAWAAWHRRKAAMQLRR